MTAYPDADERGEVVGGQEFCGLAAAEYAAPLETQPIDRQMGGIPSAGCALTAPASEPPSDLMPGSAIRLHISAVPGWIVQVTCTSTAALRADVDRGCDHVLDTIALG